jgi:hypothetical protein
MTINHQTGWFDKWFISLTIMDKTDFKDDNLKVRSWFESVKEINIDNGS